MKTYTVIGKYNDRVKMTVKAKSLKDALVAFRRAEEDELEVLNPSNIQYEEKDVKETP